MSDITPSRGAHMFTSNGRKYYPFDPRPEDVRIEVIAHHLATRCRYNGATQHPFDPDLFFYSVAEHSVYVAWYVEMVLRLPQYALEALLHDGSEGYNGDLIRPLKYSSSFKEPFKKVERLNEQAIATAFNIAYPYPEAVRVADEAVTTAEVRQIIRRDPCENWENGYLHDTTNEAPISIKMLSPAHARDLFMAVYHRLIADRHNYSALPNSYVL